MRHLGEDPADRYGYRPSTAGYALHIVLPGARVEVLDGALVAEGWCGGGWVLPHDSGAPESWGGWPACIGCLPGYFQHIVLMQLGRAPAGLSDAALGRLLPDRPVKDALLHLVAADLVEPTMTAAGATYLIRPASRASVYLEPQS